MLNVKLSPQDMKRLDEAIEGGLTQNRSTAVREALQMQFDEWERRAWDDEWENAVTKSAPNAATDPIGNSCKDEFSDLNAQAAQQWSDLD